MSTRTPQPLDPAAPDQRLGTTGTRAPHLHPETALTGEWEGFTFSEAYAWCVVLDEFESGNVLGHWRSPEPRQQRAALRAGQLPEGGSFERVARAHRSRGLTPDSYRHHREALGHTPLRLDRR